MIEKKSYKLTKYFSLVIEGERVPENSFDAKLLQGAIQTKCTAKIQTFGGRKNVNYTGTEGY